MNEWMNKQLDAAHTYRTFNQLEIVVESRKKQKMMRNCHSIAILINKWIIKYVEQVNKKKHIRRKLSKQQQHICQNSNFLC